MAAFRRRNAVVTPIRTAGLCDEHKALLRQVIKEAIQSRLTAGDLEAAMDCQRLENRILDPPVKVDWDATAAGRRIAARDARDR
jgi:hypothetical protein